MGNVKERGRLGDHPHGAKRSAPQASCSVSERWGEAAGSAKRSLTATGTKSLEELTPGTHTHWLAPNLELVGLAV